MLKHLLIIFGIGFGDGEVENGFIKLRVGAREKLALETGREVFKEIVALVSPLRANARLHVVQLHLWCKAGSTLPTPKGMVRRL